METSVPSNFMSDIEYSVITSDVIKSFDCNNLIIIYHVLQIGYFISICCRLVCTTSGHLYDLFPLRFISKDFLANITVLEWQP